MRDDPPGHLPLHNKSVLLACSAHKSSTLIPGLERLGARVIPFPTIEIRAVADTGPLDAALSHLEGYSWIIFTSSYGVIYFVRRMKELGSSTEHLRSLKVCSVGPATAATLAEADIQVSLVPEKFVAEGVISALAKLYGGLNGLAGKRILLPRAKEARDLLARELESAGARVDVVPCYENVLPEPNEEAVRSILEDSPELLVFTSSSTVTNFARLLGDADGKRLLRRATVAALGPITAKTVASLGKKVEILPRENTSASLLAAIAQFYSQADRT